MTALTPSLCYAKITPAALHCSDFSDRNREALEVTACRPDFGSRDFGREIADGSMPT
jgi:hypothetical protein